LTATAPAAEPRTSGRWLIVGLLAAALFINYVDRGTVPSAAHLIQDELHLTPRQLGLVLSAFFWSYALLQIPVGWIAERYGARRVLAAGLALWACATMLIGTVHSLLALLAMRVLLGVGESAGFPCVAKLLAQVVPIPLLGLANGITAFGYLFGPAAGAYFGALLMAHYGWRSAFWLFGALSLLWLLPWSRVVLPPRTEMERAAVAQATYPAILRQRSLWGTSLGLFSSNYGFYFVLNWLPFYLVRERGFSMSAMASLTGSAYVLNAACAVLAGYLIDAAVRRGHASAAYKLSMGVAHAGTVLCMLCIGFGSQPMALAGIFAYEVLLGMASPGAFGMSQILAGPSASARWVGIQNAIGNLAGVLAPFLTGVLVDQTHHFTTAFVVTALVSLLGLVGWVLMVPTLAPLNWQQQTSPPTRIAQSI
jgi:MFS family permease